MYRAIKSTIIQSMQKFKTVIALSSVSLLTPSVICGGCSSKTEQLTFPSFYVNTENEAPIVSKEDYVNCNVTIANTNSKYILTNEKGKIRGRGNSTWIAGRKKPYKLKFNNKINLFGNGEAKEWTLLANYFDQSLIRNYLAFSVGSLFESQPYTSSHEFVNLYLNNEYIGVYSICDQIETGKNRVDIESDLNSGPDTGYLLEMDFRAAEEGTEDINYVKIENKDYTIKSPDMSEETKDYAAFIKNYILNCTIALNDLNWSQVNNLIDAESFADSYIVNEIFKTGDITCSSFFLYKKKNSKIFCGPFWDFDKSIGNCKDLEYGLKTLWASKNIWFNKLLKFNKFKNIIKSKLSNMYEIIKNEIEHKISKVLTYSKEFEQNFLKWNKVLGQINIGNEVDNWWVTDELSRIETWIEHINFVKKYLFDSLDFVCKSYQVKIVNG